MLSSVDLVSLILFCVQQVGVVLAVGAQTVMLGSLLTSARELRIDEKKERFGRIVIRILAVGLFLMIVSGVAATALHFSFEQMNIIEAPAYIFKWILLILSSGIALYVAQRPYTHFFGEGVLGAQLYALLVLHVLAPLVGWADILIPYAIGTITFIVLWVIVVRLLLRAPKETTSAPTILKRAPVVLPPVEKIPEPVVVEMPPAPVPLPPPVVVAVPPLPEKEKELPPPALPVVVETHIAVSTPPVLPVPQKPVPELKIPQKPIEDILDEGLPTIRVMPQRPEDIKGQTRGSSVQFGEA